MLTITAKMQMDQCRKKINLLNFEQIVNSNELTYITKKMGFYEENAVKAAKQKAGDEKIDESDIIRGIQQSDAEYLEMVAYSEVCESREAAIEAEIDLLDEQMKAFEQEHQAGVEQDASLWCFS